MGDHSDPTIKPEEAVSTESELQKHLLELTQLAVQIVGLIVEELDEKSDNILVHIAPAVMAAKLIAMELNLPPDKQEEVILGMVRTLKIGAIKLNSPSPKGSN